MTSPRREQIARIVLDAIRADNGAEPIPDDLWVMVMAKPREYDGVESAFAAADRILEAGHVG